MTKTLAMRRPTRDGAHGAGVTTPQVALMMQLLGTGPAAEGVIFSRDEFENIKRLYGFVPEKPNQKPPPPKPPEEKSFKLRYQYEDALRKYEQALAAHDKWEDPLPLMQAGADRNAIRHATHDGLRLLAWIAKFVPPGEDPLKTLVQLASDAGFDVDPEDTSWAEDTSEEEG